MKGGARIMIDHAFRPPARGTGCRALPQQPGRRTVICSSRRLREIPEPCRTEARHARYIGAITSTSPPPRPTSPSPSRRSLAPLRASFQVFLSGSPRAARNLPPRKKAVKGRGKARAGRRGMATIPDGNHSSRRWGSANTRARRRTRRSGWSAAEPECRKPRIFRTPLAAVSLRLLLRLQGTLKF